ncbi:hypothetical protein BDY21DRAFT_138411 [Lineolata rhizophorae]|uniref:Uncharacterized protein n=1 Tax=Lineolata rhizophorae TaxID=578093 RepID=A0A6A6PBF9_9PEZI|nr:hypothetical protein BDY21DRAFT_138411 [Lineolata rhizophorae]
MAEGGSAGAAARRRKQDKTGRLGVFQVRFAKERTKRERRPDLRPSKRFKSPGKTWTERSMLSPASAFRPGRTGLSPAWARRGENRCALNLRQSQGNSEHTQKDKKRWRRRLPHTMPGHTNRAGAPCFPSGINRWLNLSRSFRVRITPFVAVRMTNRRATCASAAKPIAFRLEREGRWEREPPRPGAGEAATVWSATLKGFLVHNTPPEAERLDGRYTGRLQLCRSSNPHPISLLSVLRRRGAWFRQHVPRFPGIRGSGESTITGHRLSLRSIRS